MNRPRKHLYYMRPMNLYGTELDFVLLRHINHLYGFDWEVVDPNTKTHQEAYENMKRETGDGMPYFAALARNCHAGVFVPFPDGMIPAGVAREVTALLQRGCYVEELRYDGRKFRTRSLDTRRVLTVEETRSRIRDTDGTTKPFLT